MRSHLVDILILTGLLLSVCLCALTHRNTPTTAENVVRELQTAGFTIIDSDGREVVEIDWESSCGWTHTTR